MSFGPVHEGSSTLVAVQVVALTLAQVSVLPPPRAIVETSAMSDGPGAGPTTTVASVNCDAPPSPSQVRV